MKNKKFWKLAVYRTDRLLVYYVIINKVIKEKVYD